MADSTRVAAGHKANLNNPHTSVESKVHSKDVLKEEFGEDGTGPVSSLLTISFSDDPSSSLQRWQTPR